MKPIVIDAEKFLLRILSINENDRGKWITNVAHNLVQGICKENFVKGASAPSGTIQVPKTYTDDFLRFWEAYPQRSSGKQGKKAAFKKWILLKKEYPDLLELCLDALEWQKRTEDWKKEGGKYIPMPTTYLNQQRWDDDKPQTTGETWTDINGIIHHDI